MMISWSRISELRDEVGAEDFLEVVDLFLEETEEVIRRLRDNPDPGRIASDLHFLKGSALSLGFQSFSVLCQTGERLSASGQADSIDISAIIREFETSRDLFKGELQEHI